MLRAHGGSNVRATGMTGTMKYLSVGTAIKTMEKRYLLHNMRKFPVPLHNKTQLDISLEQF